MDERHYFEDDHITIKQISSVPQSHTVRNTHLTIKTFMDTNVDQ